VKSFFASCPYIKMDDNKRQFKAVIEERMLVLQDIYYLENRRKG
jgi:hypothetical protein